MSTLRHFEVNTFVPSPEQYAWTFGGAAPVMEINPREPFEVFTEDAFGGRLTSSEDLPSAKIQYPFINPQTGPFYVKGAEPGDALAVHLIDVRPARGWGVSTTVPLFGALTGTVFTATLQEPLPERTWIYQVDDRSREVVFQALDSPYTTRLPLQPFLGTIGVAPAAGEVRNVLVPERFGGNMDTPEARGGTTIYLGVNVPGALLSVGDGHYTMGDGEVCGVAVEGSTFTSLVVDVIKGGYCDWPRLENDTAIMVAGSCRPLEDAFRIGHTQLIRWIASENPALSLMDAYQLVTQASTTRIANVCDPNYTIVARMPKRFLPAGRAYAGGTHSVLREVARTFLASRD